MRQKRLTNTDIAGAQTLYDKALKFNSDHPTVLYNYAVLLEDARQAETLNTFFECYVTKETYCMTKETYYRLCLAGGCAPGRNSQHILRVFQPGAHPREKKIHCSSTFVLHGQWIPTFSDFLSTLLPRPCAARQKRPSIKAKEAY